MIAPSATRVTENTSEHVNQEIQQQTEMSIAYYAQHPELIDARLAQLDHEWDVERALETGSSLLTLTGLLMTLAGRRKGMLLSMAVQGFFLQHAIEGWCPPLPLLRRLGFRTADEINQERNALMGMRERQSMAS